MRTEDFLESQDVISAWQQDAITRHQMIDFLGNWEFTLGETLEPNNHTATPNSWSQMVAARIGGELVDADYYEILARVRAKRKNSPVVHEN